MIRFRKNDELFGTTATPARRNREPVFLVDEMTELSRVERLGVLGRSSRGVHGRVVNFSISPHFSPPLTTLPASMSTTNL